MDFEFQKLKKKNDQKEKNFQFRKDPDFKFDPVMFAKDLIKYGDDIPGECYNNNGSKSGSPMVYIKSFKGVIGWESFVQLDTDGSGEPPFKDPDRQNTTNLHSKSQHLDANKIPYIVLPSSNKIQDVLVGDLGILVDTEKGKYIFVIYGDKGPKTKIGEASVAAHRELGLTDGKKNRGYEEEGLVYIVFPKSRLRYDYGEGKKIPTTFEEVQKNGKEILDRYLCEEYQFK